MRRQYKYKPLSSDALHWSQENQIAFCTHDAIFIITPSDKLISTQILSRKTRPKRFVLENDYNNLDHIRSSQLLNDSYFTVSWSPTGISSLGGCLLLSISSNHYVEVYEPVDDPKSGAWDKILDLASTIEDLSNDANKKLDQLQSTCSGWSARIPHSKSCMVALGDKSGRIIIIQIDQAKIINTSVIQVCDSWVSKCAWSDWKQKDNTLLTHLATASANGSVKIWTVKFDQTSIKVDFFQEICGPDRLLVTSISFDLMANYPKLAFSKGYSLWTWILQGGSKVSSVKLPCFMNICGIIWSSFEDSIRAYSADGMCFSLALDKSGSLIMTGDDSLRLKSLINEKPNESLEVDETIEQQDTEEEEDHRIVLYGAASSCNGLYDCILYDSVKPYDMNYITLADESCSVLIRSIPDGNDETTLEDISSIFANSTKVLNPSYNLWDILEFFKNSNGSLLEEIQAQLVLNSQNMFQESPNLFETKVLTQGFSMHKLACYLSLYKTKKLDSKLYIESVMFYVKYLLSTYQKKESLSSSDSGCLFLIKSLFEAQNWQVFLQKDSKDGKFLDSLFGSFKSLFELQSNPENCAVCDLPVSVGEFDSANCPNGHSWHRCSQCFKCIFSFTFLECIGCHAKVCIDSNGPCFCLICGCQFRRIGVAFS